MSKGYCIYGEHITVRVQTDLETYVVSRPY